MKTRLLPLLLLPLAAACGDPAEIQATELLARLRAGSDKLPPGPWLAVDEDGTVWCPNGKLYWPGVSSEGRIDPFHKGEPDEYWRLADWLREVAAPSMPVEERTFWNGDWPVRNGDLRVWIHPNAFPVGFSKVLECCLRPGIGIYRYEIPLGGRAAPARGRLDIEGCRWDPPQRADVWLRIRAGRNPLREEGRSSQDRWCQLLFSDQRAEERRFPYPMEEFSAWLVELGDGTEVDVGCEPRIRFHQIVPVLEHIRERPGLQLVSIREIPFHRRSLLFGD